MTLTAMQEIAIGQQGVRGKNRNCEERGEEDSYEAMLELQRDSFSE